MDTNLLLTWGATLRKVDKGDIVFQEGEEARYYYQIELGEIKMVNISEDGKEFIQGIFGVGQSFGEPPLFIEERYPASALACKKSVLYYLPKDRFLQIIAEYRYLEIEFLQVFARRLYQKALTAKELTQSNPEKRIINLLSEYKKREGLVLPSEIRLTRQEIANLAGLRVETVIRTLSRLNKLGKVKIDNRKLYF